MRKVMIDLFLTLTLIMMFFTHNLAAMDFYISPKGNDSNPGSKEAPFQTLAKARDAVRQVNKGMNEDIIVHLSSGTYPVQETVVFTSQDSGKNGGRVIYRGSEESSPVLTGGLPLTDWVLHDSEAGIYRAKAPKKGFRQLYIDNKLAIRARTPNRKPNETFGPYMNLLIHDQEPMVTTQQWDMCKEAKSLENVELVMNSHWYHQRIRVKDVTPVDNGFIVNPVNSEGKFNKNNSHYRHAVFYWEGAYAFLDQPYEWHLDSKSSTVYLVCQEGQNPNNMHIEVPQNSTLIDIRGTAEAPVENISFEGITFQCSNWNVPSERGLNVTQFVRPVGVEPVDPDFPTGMLQAAHASKLSFRGNTFRNAGANGIQFFVNVDKTDIVENRITNVAANGIVIDENYTNNPNPAPEEQSTEVAIWNNDITKCGQDYTNGGGILAYNVRGLIIEHNHIYDMPYSGIQVGAQPGGLKDVGCGENMIRYNHIHHCVKLHDDGGGIYTLGGIQKGTVIAENYLHDIKRTRWAGNYKIDLIYLDNYSSQILVKDNIVRGGKAAERNHSKGNTLQNNTQENPEVEKNAGIKIGYNPR